MTENHSSPNEDNKQSFLDWGIDSGVPYDASSEAGYSQIEVRKPQKNEFIRVFPGEANEAWHDTTLYEHSRSRAFFLIHPQMRPEFAEDAKAYRLRVVMNRQQVLFMWPMKLPTGSTMGDKWSNKALAIASLAESTWLKIQVAGGNYQEHLATGNLAEPVWPDIPFADLMDRAFAAHVVDSLDHAVLKELRGEV